MAKVIRGYTDKTHLQYCSIKARDVIKERDAINRRLYKNQSFVETAIYRVWRIYDL
ncbi:hypothetical protein [Nostoc sp.]|uniref:hypothetical protein n=1 Tax=Nostoc sp. TaxID=1180 RepID=UPI002FFBE568